MYLYYLWFFLHTFVDISRYLSSFFWGEGEEIPRLGIESELQLLAYAIATQDLSCICDLQHRPWQRQSLNPLSRARDWIHILMILVSLVTTEPQQELQLYLFLIALLRYISCIISFSYLNQFLVLQYFVVYSQNCATFTTINFRIFSSAPPPKKNPIPIVVTSHFPSTCPYLLTLGNQFWFL